MSAPADTLARVVPKRSTPERVAPWLIVAIAIVVYAGSLANGFVLDDEGIITRNDLVHELSGMWRAFVTPYWPNGAGQYRPLVIASFSAEWTAWSGRPVGFHAVNVAWHAAASLLVFTLARRWLSLGGAAIAGALFAVHPVHVEAVANVVGRAELMAACGVLAMLLLHVRRSPWAPVAFAVALFSKEHAMVAPLLAAFVDLAERRASLAPSHDPPVKGALARIYGGYAFVAVAWFAIVLALFRGRTFAAIDPFWISMDAPTRWLTMLGVVPVWIRLWFFPAELSADYSPRVTLPWPENTASATLGAVMLAAAMILVVALVSRRRLTAPAIAFAWIVVAMAPIANLVVPTGVIVAERTLYLSSVGAVLLAGFVAEWAALRRREVTLVLAAALVVTGGVRAWRRAEVWKTNRSLFLATAESVPHGSWSHVSLARIFAGNGGHADAARELIIALKLFDGRSDVWAEAIQAAARSHDMSLADSLIERAEARFANDYLISIAHGSVALEQRRFAAAVRAARAARTAAPDSAAAFLLEGYAWAALGERDSSKLALSRVRAGHPLRPPADSLLRQLQAPPQPPPPQPPQE